MSAFRAIDMDTHYYEPKDCFTRHIEPRFRDKAVHFRMYEGHERLFVGDRLQTFFEDPTYSTIEGPGELQKRLARGEYSSKADVERVPVDPGFRNDRDRRLQIMDEQGVDACVILPTVGIGVEHFMKDDPEQTFANLRAFNTWLNEDWGFDYRGRIYGVPLLSLLDLDLAVQELERVIKMGARAIHLRPGPQGGRSPGDPCFDPFWERVNEAKLLVAFHIAESGYNEMFSVHWGEQANPSSHHQSAFQWTNVVGDRPIMDTCSALIYDNFFARFPNINIISIENGSLWVSYLVKAMDKMKGMGRHGQWRGGYVKGKPSLIFRERVFVVPYPEEDIGALVNTIGASQVVFGSDFPHPEGLARPLSFAEKLVDQSSVEVQMIMGHNAARLLNVA